MFAWGMGRNTNVAAKEDNNNLGWPPMMFISNTFIPDRFEDLL